MSRFRLARLFGYVWGGAFRPCGRRGEVSSTAAGGLHVAAQVAAAAGRAGELDAALQSQDRAFRDALREMQAVRDFVGLPANILGRTDTKHGEIAEQIHVAVTRARDVLRGRAPTATFDGVPRTGPVDYRVDGVDIQSKYYNGLRNTLDGVASHAEKYPHFADVGGRYHIPRDQLAALRRTGGIEGLSDRSAGAIQRRVDDLEQATGRPARVLIEPGEADYAEAQRGRVHDTLRDREERLAQENARLKEAARAEHGPSMAGAAGAAAFGALAGAGNGLAQAVYVKYRRGKNPFRGGFNVEDWRDVGVVTAQGAGGGGVAGGAVYLLTNSSALAAPFAGSLVSGLMGVGELLKDYHAGAIGLDEFVDLSLVVGLDAAVAGLASASGQKLIPIPVLGALLGSLAGKLVASALRDSLGASALTEHLAQYERYALSQLDLEFRALIAELDVWFGGLERLAVRAFDPQANAALRLAAAVRIAETVGVPAAQILRTPDDLDAFMKE